MLMIRIIVTAILCTAAATAFSQAQHCQFPPQDLHHSKWKYSLISCDAASAATAPLAMQTASSCPNWQAFGRDPRPMDQVVFRPCEYKYGMFVLHQPMLHPKKVRQRTYPSY
jgi:hypothetical protein